MVEKQQLGGQTIPPKTIQKIPKNSGSKCLIVGGGPSGKSWRDLYNSIQADYIIGVNGVSSIVHPNYALVVENHAHTMAWWTKLEADEYVVSVNNLRFLDKPYENKWMCRRKINPGLDMIHDGYLYKWKASYAWDCRKPDNEYDLLCGCYWTDRGQPDGIVRRRDIGTILSQAMHFASILGATEIHTIGFDLAFTNTSTHWYPERNYDKNAGVSEKTWHPNMYTNFEGLETTHWMLESACFMHLISPLLPTWYEYSKGLMSKVAHYYPESKVILDG